MKKMIYRYAFMAGLCMALTGVAFADGSAFTPLNFDDTVYGKPAAVSPVVSETTGNESMQSAIQKLDNAQVEVRNELLNVKTQFADVDAQYQSFKSQRKALNKQIRSIERRIDQIDRAKEKIRKNMI